MLLAVPEAFARAVERLDGGIRKRWLADLPAVIEHLLDEWELEPDGEVRHGTAALVVPVRRTQGEAALKVGWVDDETRFEPLALRWWGGRGAVRLLVGEPDLGALLLERLDPHRTLQDAPESQAVDAAAAVLRRLHVPPPVGLPLLVDRAGRWEAELVVRWRALGRLVESALVEQAIATCRELVLDPGPAVLLHGDLHFGNVLAGGACGWSAIDPQPLVGDAEFDLLPLLRNRWQELVATGDPARAVRTRLARLVEGADLDLERARRWSQARSVEDALWGQEQQRPEFAAIAWAIAEALS